MTKRLFQYFNQMRHEWVMMTVKVWELTQIDYLGEDSEKHFGHNSWVCFAQIYELQIWQTLVHRLLRLGQNLQKPRFFFYFFSWRSVFIPNNNLRIILSFFKKFFSQSYLKFTMKISGKFFQLRIFGQKIWTPNWVRV